MRARIAAVVLLLLASTPGRAQGPLPPEGPVAEKAPEPHDPSLALADPSQTSYWGGARTRTFVATSIDVGYLYLRPRVSFGYGKPFSKWIGLDLNPAAGNRFLAGYAGVRAALPLVDLRIGGRYVWAFQQHFLAPLSKYNRLEMQDQSLDRSQYLSLEAEFTGRVAAGPGSFLGVLSGSYIMGVPKGVYVFEETLRVIIEAPYVWRARVGYVVRLGEEGKLSLGPVVETLGIPGRDRLVVRAGVIGSATLSDHIDVVGTLIPPVFSPDTIGIAGGDFAQLGIRYRWASGSPPDPVPQPPPLRPESP